MLEACARREGWSSKVAAAIEAALDFAVADPHAANLLTNEALAQGGPGLARYQRLISYLAEHLSLGRRERGENARLPEITERALASGVATLIAQRLDNGREGELSALAPEIVQFVLTPYVGVEQARQQASGTNL
jgi:hypothetical protein